MMAPTIAAPLVPTSPSTFYRGVESIKVAESLNGAEDLLRQLDLGPATGKILADWKAQRPLDEISAAKNDVELAATMRRVGFEFRRYQEVFKHHALADLLDKDGKGGAADLYRGLSSWGAFDGAEILDYRPIDEEMGLHLTLERTKLLKKSLRPGDLAEARYREILETIRQDQNNPQHSNWVAKAAPMILKARAEGRRGRVIHAFKRMDLWQRHVLDRVLQYALGLHLQDERLATESPLGIFGIAANGLPYDFGKMQEILKPIIEKAHAILEPFYETDEIDHTAIGLINYRSTPVRSGFVFKGTRRAAQAVADAMPDQEVIDFKGERIFPRLKPTSASE